MSSWLDRLKELWARVFKRHKQSPLIAQQIEMETAPAIVQPPQQQMPEPTVGLFEGNRKERRALERARRRYDKFIKPTGTPEVKPVKASRPKRVAKPPEPAPEPPANGWAEWPVTGANIIYGPHSEDESENPPNVLFEESEFLGEFNFRDTILDQLDRYFVYLRRMRRHDRDSYELYKNVGATLVPYAAMHLDQYKKERKEPYKFSPATIESMRRAKPDQFFILQRPSFGCVAVGTDPHHERVEQELRHMWHPKFLYFVKYNRPPSEIEPTSGGDVYKLTIWWDRPDLKHKHGTPQEFGVFVSADGKDVRALKDLGPAHQRRKFESGWEYPHDLKKWARGHGIDVQIFLRHIFCMAVNMSTEANNASMARVSVTKEDETATFGVNVKRMGYFFKDRDVTLDGGGRIFHSVRPHGRDVGGKKSYVKMHFRGLREFTWAGYRVLITVPQLHHMPISDFNVGMMDSEWLEKGQRVVTPGQIGQMFAEHIKTGKDLAKLLPRRNKPKREPSEPVYRRAPEDASEPSLKRAPNHESEPGSGRAP